VSETGFFHERYPKELCGLAITQQTTNGADEQKRPSSLDISALSLRLNHLRSEAVAVGPSKMALSTRSLDKSQHCPQCSS
jgi:hypothetical protein